MYCPGVKSLSIVAVMNTLLSGPMVPEVLLKLNHLGMLEMVNG